MIQKLYWGMDVAHAENPHELDYSNPAIQVQPLVQKATGEINVSLWLSCLTDNKVDDNAGNLDVTVKFTYASATQQATWYYPDQRIEEWQFEIPRNQKSYIKAPVKHCIWTKSLTWKADRKLYIHGRYFTLVATLECKQTKQHPTQLLPATDPCVAIHSSLSVPDLG